MKWPKMFDVLREEAEGGAPDNGGGGGGTDATKVTINGKVYDISKATSALSLYEALEDPDTGSEIVETLARKAGLLDKKGDLPEKITEKQAKTRMAQALKNKLGKDYDKFSDLVGPAFEEVLEEMLTEKFGEQEQRNSTTSWEKGIEKFVEQHTLTPEIETKMKELMDEAPPNTTSKSFKQQNYLARMYRNAIEELDIEAPAPKRTAANGRPTNDVPEFTMAPRPKNLSLDAALDAAVAGIRFKR